MIGLVFRLLGMPVVSQADIDLLVAESFEGIGDFE